MKTLKKFTAAMILIALFAVPSFALDTTNALTQRPENSIYGLIKLQNLSGFVSWLLSRENLNIAAKFAGNDTLDAETIDLICNVVENLNFTETALLVGNDSGKEGDFFVQSAFKLKPENDELLTQFKSGKATAEDVAKLLLGKSALAPMLATMLDVKFNNGIYTVSNMAFLSIMPDDMFIAASSNEEILKAIESYTGKARLLENVERKYNTPDFIYSYCDYKLLSAFDKDAAKEAAKYFKQPLKLETAFDLQPEKFIFSMSGNFVEAMTDEYAAQIKEYAPVKGGNINFDGIGGEASPLFAIGMRMNMEAAKDLPGFKDFLDLFKFARRFGITEDDIVKFLSGAFSLAINDSVPFQGMKFPAVFFSQTSETAPAIFEKIAKAKQFSEVKTDYAYWEKLLQADNSLSPVSCLVGKSGNTLGVSIAEATTFNARPVLNPELQKLADTLAFSALWIDFAGLQSWIQNTGALGMLAPLAMVGGATEQFKAFADIINAKFSVPYISSNVPEIGTVQFEFGLAEVPAGEGVLTKIADAYVKFAK